MKVNENINLILNIQDSLSFPLNLIMLIIITVTIIYKSFPPYHHHLNNNIMFIIIAINYKL